MKTIIPLTLIFFILACCGPTVGQHNTQPPAAAPRAAAPATASLSGRQRAAIGRKIWQNESGGTKAGLTAWNEGEAFPSLGIGHFIWYPAGQRGPYTESFPRFIAFANQHGANPPGWTINRPCPWSTREAFMNDFNGPRLAGLREWLANNITIQTDFIVAKSRESLPKILAVAGPSATRVRDNYHRVATTSNGQYALIDYVNFKGEGINPAERYNGQGWGLLQVLQDMKTTPAGQPAAAEFAAASKRVLSRRVANSGGKDKRWLAGWLNRCSTYAQPL